MLCSIDNHYTMASHLYSICWYTTSVTGSWLYGGIAFGEYYELEFCRERAQDCEGEKREQRRWRQIKPIDRWHLD